MRLRRTPIRIQLRTDAIYPVLEGNVRVRLAVPPCRCSKTKEGRASPTHGVSTFAVLPSWKLDPYGLVGHSLAWQTGSRHGCRGPAQVGEGLRLTVSVSGISELSCARWLLGYNDGGADGKHP
jgi:hypothetical protein